MEYTILGEKNDIAFRDTAEPIINGTQSALDFIMSARYETGCDKFILNKASITEDFFKLSTGVAGEVLQKFINYRAKLAVVGDYSAYTSKPLHDFIYESNNGRDIFFMGSVEEAVASLSKL